MRENATQHKHIEFGLVISNENCGARCTQIIIGILDDKGYAGCKPHRPFESASDGPLRYAIVSYEAEENGDEYSIGSANDETNITSEETSEESGKGKDW